MKILTLIIKQKFFDQIMNGSKKVEYRELTPQNAHKLVEFDSEGYMLEGASENEPNIPKKYDAIRFYVGYAKDRDTALVKITDTKAVPIKDEQGRFLYSGEPESPDFWVYVMIEYYLGEIIEKKHTHKAK